MASARKDKTIGSGIGDGSTPGANDARAESGELVRISSEIIRNTSATTLQGRCYGKKKKPTTITRIAR